MIKLLWSTDSDRFNLDSKEEAIKILLLENDPEDLLNTIIYCAIASKPTGYSLIDAEDVFDLMAERACDARGEWADGVPIASKEGITELNEVLKDWIEKWAETTFYTINEFKEHRITEADLKGFE